MTRQMKTTSRTKSKARQAAKTIRRRVADESAAPQLITHFPPELERGIIAGFASIKDEIDLWPLLTHLHKKGRQVCLPVTPKTPDVLSFRQWTPDSLLNTDRYGVSFPMGGTELIPDVVFVPLLAFTKRGERLGYGGGYFDRTLQALREAGEVFACGVAYAGQEMAELPTDAHDQRLDGILTETGFRTFT